ncbi:hypothetical protein Ahia01_001383000, partial [Argonauta hians]
NSIRHNLSLHNRFMRVPNEGSGKSSWWVINPDAKPGKSPRRRAGSMETKVYEKKKNRAKKKADQLRALEHGGNSPTTSSDGDLLTDSPVPGFQLSPDFDFRPRASSNASSCGRLSPIQAVIEPDLHDSQVPPMSPIPWSAEMETEGPPSLDSYAAADQLVDSLPGSMSLTDEVSLGQHHHHHHLPHHHPHHHPPPHPHLLPGVRRYTTAATATQAAAYNNNNNNNSSGSTPPPPYSEHIRASSQQQQQHLPHHPHHHHHHQQHQQQQQQQQQQLQQVSALDALTLSDHDPTAAAATATATTGGGGVSLSSLQNGLDLYGQSDAILKSIVGGGGSSSSNSDASVQQQQQLHQQLQHLQSRPPRPPPPPPPPPGMHPHPHHLQQQQQAAAAAGDQQQVHLRTVAISQVVHHNNNNNNKVQQQQQQQQLAALGPGAPAAVSSTSVVVAASSSGVGGIASVVHSDYPSSAASSQTIAKVVQQQQQQQQQTSVQSKLNNTSLLQQQMHSALPANSILRAALMHNAQPLRGHTSNNPAAAAGHGPPYSLYTARDMFGNALTQVSTQSSPSPSSASQSSPSSASQSSSSSSSQQSSSYVGVGGGGDNLACLLSSNPAPPPSSTISDCRLSNTTAPGGLRGANVLANCLNGGVGLGVGLRPHMSQLSGGNLAALQSRVLNASSVDYEGVIGGGGGVNPPDIVVNSSTSLSSTSSSSVVSCQPTSYPCDIDLEMLWNSTNLECDVAAVIQHELSLNENLDFNFDPLPG